MGFLTHRNVLWYLRWASLPIALVLPYATFWKTLIDLWSKDPASSYGFLVPFLVGYLIWTRRDQLGPLDKTPWAPGLGIVVASCALQIVASLNGTLILSGVAFAMAVVGIIGFLWGLACVRIVAGPLAVLVVMVPLPSFAMGELSWHLQAGASTVSSVILRLLGVPVFQDGNLLALSNYVLEVKQACSGSRSIFALLALALVLGLSVQRSWWIRILLLVAAPVLAVATNVIRIVGTGLIAKRWGSLAANESLHTVWGVLVFIMAVSGLLALERVLRWAKNEYA